MLKERLNDVSVENNFAKWLPSEEKIKEFAVKTYGKVYYRGESSN